MTALLEPKRLRPAIPLASAPAPNRVVLHGVDWDTYCTVADAFPNRPIRITYDRGAMEVMTVAGIHERLKSLFAYWVLAMADELDLDIACFGSFTNRRKDLARALESDSCFYVANFALVNGRTDIDLEKDPPPDLEIEVEISRSLLDRLAILQALRVGEVWRVDQRRIRALVLRGAVYEEVEQSPTFPEVPLTEMHRLVVVGVAHGERAMLKELRAWLRKTKKKSKRK